MIYLSKKKMQKLTGFLAFSLVMSVCFAPVVQAENKDDYVQKLAEWWEKKTENGRKRLDKASELFDEKKTEVQEWFQEWQEKTFGDGDESQKDQDGASTRALTFSKSEVEKKKEPLKLVLTVAEAVKRVQNSEKYDFNIDTLTLLVNETGLLPYVLGADGQETPLFAYGCWSELKELHIQGHGGSLTDLKNSDFLALSQLKHLSLVNHPYLRRMPKWIFSANFLENLEQVFVADCGFPYKGEQENKVRLFRKECLLNRDNVTVTYGEQQDTNYTWVEYFYTMGGSYSLREWKRWLESEPEVMCQTFQSFKAETELGK